MIVPFLLFLAVVSLVLTIYSLMRSNLKPKDIMLALLGLSLAIYQIGSVVAIGDRYFSYPHLAGIAEPFFVLLPVLVFFIIRENTGQYIQIRDGLHVLPFFTYLLIMGSFYMMSRSEKVRAYDSYLEMNPGNVWEMLLPAMSLIIVAVYVFASQRRMEDWQKKVYQWTSDPDLINYSSIDGLRWLMWSLVAMLISILFVSVGMIDGIQYYTILVLAFSFAYLRFCWSQFFTREYKIPSWVLSPPLDTHSKVVEWPECHDEADMTCTPADEGFMWKSSDGIQLSANEIRQQAWYNHLNHRLYEYQWWQEPSLSILDVSERIGLSVPLLHRLLAERERGTFFDYINRKRVEYIKKKIRESPMQQIDVQRLATMSGFRSSGSLKEVFSYYTGSSLKTYRRLSSIAYNH